MSETVLGRWRETVQTMTVFGCCLTSKGFDPLHRDITSGKLYNRSYRFWWPWPVFKLTGQLENNDKYILFLPRCLTHMEVHVRVRSSVFGLLNDDFFFPSSRNCFYKNVFPNLQLDRALPDTNRKQWNFALVTEVSTQLRRTTRRRKHVFLISSPRLKLYIS